MKNMDESESNTVANGPISQIWLYIIASFPAWLRDYFSFEMQFEMKNNLVISYVVSKVKNNLVRCQ